MNEHEHGPGAGLPDLFRAASGPAEAGPSLEELLADTLHEDNRDLVEALIFASDTPLPSAQLAELLEWEAEAVEDAIQSLNADYGEQGRSFRLERLAGGWQLVSRRRYAPLLSRLLKARVRPRLSRAALETLAVAAYKQPVTKGEIEAIRGVKADGVLRTLLDRGLLTISGRSDAVGRPLLYRTTRGFLEAFALADLDELPRMKEVQELLKGRDDSHEEDLPPEPLRERRPSAKSADLEPESEADASPGPVEPTGEDADAGDAIEDVDPVASDDDAEHSGRPEAGPETQHGSPR